MTTLNTSAASPLAGNGKLIARSLAAFIGRLTTLARQAAIGTRAANAMHDFKWVAELDEHLLRDIGIARSEIFDVIVRGKAPAASA